MNRTAFITGGSSGIGLSFARRLARGGAKLALVDRDAGGLDRAVAELGAMQATAIGLVCDVGDRAQFRAAAEQAEADLGPVHYVMNNAGVAVAGPIEEVTPEVWDWMMRVNLMGVIHGIEIFVPRLKARGEGHIINTASMAGMRGLPMMGPYCATKAAVVSLSETLYAELKPLGIGVSVLCPGFVKTRLHVTSSESDPSRDASTAGGFSPFIDAGIPVEVVAERLAEAIAAGEFYVFTHPGYREIVEKRCAALHTAFESASQSPALAGVDTALPPGIR
jgi:NAD(P)-dependent dehydrogenase (short-subunit alcohol dehydrogenase family)